LVECNTKQSHYLRYPALELLCNSFCGPLAKEFVDAWYKSILTQFTQKCWKCAETREKLKKLDEQGKR